MTSSTLRFLILLLGVLLLVFGIHITILHLLESPLFENRIIISYVLNYVLAALLLFLIQSNFNKQSANTAFIFMLGSGIKFVIFFILFYPIYQEDGVMQKAEFTSFFVPYAICLTLEVIFLSKQLNNQTYS